jgi:tRNA(Ile2) C34 agmatinyltransferase TiaS
MAAEAQHGAADEATCPHCNRHFTAPLLAGSASQRGFKCPHCRLFVPLDRSERAA